MFFLFAMLGLSACVWSQPSQVNEVNGQNCVEPEKPLDHADIVQLAKNEVTKREPNAITADVGVRWSSELCAWHAIVQLRPEGPGRQRDVVISNAGKVTLYLRGR